MAKKREDWDYNDYMDEYQSLLLERSEWEAEARKISSFILPGRGIFNNLTRPAKRKLTSPKVVNPVAKDALRVLTSGLQGGLTSPSRPWFKLSFQNEAFNKHPLLSRWLYDCEKVMYSELSTTNFYPSVHTFYTEYCGFGTGSLYVGEDGEPFRFELPTFGEFCIGLDSKGRVNRFYRVMFKTGKMLWEDYGESPRGEVLPKQFYKEETRKKLYNTWYTLLECTVPRKFQDKPFTRVVYLLGEGDASKIQRNEMRDSTKEPLEITGFYEFPWPTGRFDVIGSDVYGIGPAAEALPDVMRLQEMEKSASMAVHKAASPPLFVPAHLKGKIKTLPGGMNYSRNTMNEKVTTLYDTRFDYAGVVGFVDRVVMRIRQAFYNDVFLTASRDPNASPLKATQVQAQELEKMLRLGPMIERLHFEFFTPLLERCWNILLRKGYFPALPPELQAMVEGAGFEIKMVSVLAQAQKAIGVQAISSFVSFVGAVASVDQKVLDNINADSVVREFADITGVPSIILNSQEDVQGIRQQRQQMMEQKEAEQKRLMAAAAQEQILANRANVAKTASEAGVNMAEVIGGPNGIQ